jgi:3-hydroxyacyl-CoA dehydrogenase
MMSGAGGRIAAVSPGNTTVGIVGLGDMGAAIASAIERTFPVIALEQAARVGLKMCVRPARVGSINQQIAKFEE